MNDYNDKAREMYERSMEEIYDHLDKVRSYIEKASDKIDNAKLSEEDWKMLDDLLSKAINSLDKIN